MKRFIASLLVIAFVLVPALAFAAESCTQTAEVINAKTGLKKVTFAWVSSATGTVTCATNSQVTAFLKGLYIVRVVTNPGATAPTDDWDATITDADGVDMMGGVLANRDTTNSEEVLPYIGGLAYGPNPIPGQITLNITNAGDSKTGTVVLYMQ